MQLILKITLQVQQNTKIFSISNIELGLGIGSVNRKYVLTGHMWSAIRELFPHKVNHILQHAAIFARMSADQKQQVIQELQAMEFYVGKIIPFVYKMHQK